MNNQKIEIPQELVVFFLNELLRQHPDTVNAIFKSEVSSQRVNFSRVALDKVLLRENGNLSLLGVLNSIFLMTGKDIIIKSTANEEDELVEFSLTHTSEQNFTLLPISEGDENEG